MCWRTGLPVLVQCVKICARGWPCSCAMRYKQDRVHSQIFRCRSQRPYYVFTGCSTFVDAVRYPDALRPLTLCNCDCKILTTAICRGLHSYTMRCIHPSQRCISSRQKTDNIFEGETTALAHVACSPRESGILLTDFAAAYLGVNHSWIFHVLEKAELPEFMCPFLRMIYLNSTTQVEFCWKKQEAVSYGQGSGERIPLCNGLRPYFFDGSRTRPSQKTLPIRTFSNLLHVPMLTNLQWPLLPSVW